MDGKEQRFHEKDIKDDCESISEDSIGSCLSSCSSDLIEDVTSSTSASSSSSSSNGPLYELSELMAQLPIKRGLSKYYEGKSQSFTSLASVKSLEDLAKRGRPSKRTMKLRKSYGGGLDNHMLFSPKATISKKKNSRISLLSTPKITKSGTIFTDFGVS